MPSLVARKHRQKHRKTRRNRHHSQVFSTGRTLLVATSLYVVFADYDFVVIGAGTAGSIVSGELARREGYRILLIEAGGDNFDPSITNLSGYFDVAFNTFNYGFLQWGLQTTPQELRGLGEEVEPREIGLPMGKCLGGSHSINACAFVQGHSSDFDTIAAELGDPAWKWDATKRGRHRIRQTLDPIKVGIEQIGGKQFVTASEEALGLPYNAEPLDGDQYGIGASYWTAKEGVSSGIRVTAYEAFAKPMSTTYAKDGKVDVVTFHQVEKLIFDDTKVIGVSCKNTRANVSHEFHAKKEVILSAGAYNSPKVLMLSGIGASDQLDALGIETKVELKGVGENFRDHYSAATFWNLVDLPADAPILFQSPTFNVFGPEKKGPPSYQMEISGNFGSITPLRTQSVGTVRLGSADVDTPVTIDPNILGTAEDVQLYVDGLRTILIPFFRSLVDQNLISEGNFDLDWNDDELVDFVFKNLETNHHPTGTCKVGTSDDELAVVDKDFKIFGLSSIRVVDASIFPFLPSGNTNAATMTAAMIAVDKIAQEYRSSKT